MQIEQSIIVNPNQVMAPRRETVAQRLTRQAGMTLLEILIVLTIMALVVGLIFGPRIFKMFADSKTELAKITVQDLANNAFLGWSRANPSKGCPSSLTDLSEYMNKKDTKDPWGNEFTMYCGDSLPPGARGFAVMSNGEDGKPGTPDDIKSWE